MSENSAISLDEAIEAAKQKYADGEYAAAIDFCLSYLRRNKRSGEIAFILGMSMAEDVSRRDAAITALYDALVLPDLSSKHRNLALFKIADIHIAASRLGDAESILKQVSDWTVIEADAAPAENAYDQYISKIKEYYEAEELISKCISGVRTFDLVNQNQNTSHTRILSTVSNGLILLQRLFQQLGNVPAEVLPQLHQQALKNIPLFVEGHTLSIASVIEKSFELAFAQLNNVGVASGGHVCDLAAASSFVVEQLPQLNESKVYGFEISAEGLRVVNENRGYEGAFVADCLALPVKDNSFDLLFGSSALEFSSDVKTALQEFARVSGKSFFSYGLGGDASASVNIDEYISQGCNLVAKYLAARNANARAAGPSSMEEFKKLISEAGLEIESSTTYFSSDTRDLINEPDLLDLFGPSVRALCFSDPLKETVMQLMSELCKMIIVFDARCNRDADTRVACICKSMSHSGGAEFELKSPRSGSAISVWENASAVSGDCDSELLAEDGMFFLLPEELSEIQSNYASRKGYKVDPVCLETAKRIHDESIVYIVHDHDPIKDDLPIYESMGLTGKGFIPVLDTEITGSLNYYSAAFDGWSDRCLKTIKEVRQEIDSQPNRLILVRETDDILKAKDSGKLAILLGSEGAKLLEGEVDSIDKWYDLGLRQLQLNWSWTNQMCASFLDENDGLTDKGKALIKKMNELGMLIDLTHSSEKAYYEAIELSDKPIIFSHGGCRTIVEKYHPEFLTRLWVYFNDDNLRAMRDCGGILGIHFLKPFFYRKEGELSDTTLDVILEHFDHAINIMGIDHVVLGCDYLPDYGSWYFMQEDQNSLPIDYVIDKADLVDFTAAFLARGYTEEDAKKVIGGNFMRVCREVIG